MRYSLAKHWIGLVASGSARRRGNFDVHEV
jgi:hypothetical protein